MTSTAAMPNEKTPSVEQLERQIEAVFGTPRSLSDSEQAQAQRLRSAIDSLLNEADGQPLGEDDQELLERFSDQLSSLQGVRRWEQLSADEQQKVEILFDQLEQLTADADEAPSTGDNPHTRLEEIFGTPRELTAQEHQKAAELQTQLGAILEDEQTELDDQQLSRIHSLFDELDALHGVRRWEELSTAEQNEVEQLYEQLNIHSDSSDLSNHSPPAGGRQPSTIDTLAKRFNEPAADEVVSDGATGTEEVVCTGEKPNDNDILWY